MSYVYLPDDEPDSAFCNGVEFHLLPNSATEIRSPFKHLTSDQVADHVASKLKQWGTVKVSGPVENGKASTPADQALVDEAEATYLKATKEWAEALVMARAAKNKPRTDSGLPPIPPSADEAKAEKWLGAKFESLKAAGLI